MSRPQKYRREAGVGESHRCKGQLITRFIVPPLFEAFADQFVGNIEAHAISDALARHCAARTAFPRAHVAEQNAHLD